MVVDVVFVVVLAVRFFVVVVNVVVVCDCSPSLTAVVLVSRVFVTCGCFLSSVAEPYCYSRLNFVVIFIRFWDTRK